jgi:hypothetical protein
MEVNSDIVVPFQLFDIKGNSIALLGSDLDSTSRGRLRSISNNGNEHGGVATFLGCE